MMMGGALVSGWGMEERWRCVDGGDLLPRGVRQSNSIPLADPSCSFCFNLQGVLHKIQNFPNHLEWKIRRKLVKRQPLIAQCECQHCVLEGRGKRDVPLRSPKPFLLDDNCVVILIKLNGISFSQVYSRSSWMTPVRHLVRCNKGR